MERGREVEGTGQYDNEYTSTGVTLTAGVFATKINSRRRFEYCIISRRGEQLQGVQTVQHQSHFQAGRRHPLSPGRCGSIC